MTAEEITEEYQNVEYNPKTYSYDKNDLCTAFTQARCNNRSFESWFKFNKYKEL